MKILKEISGLLFMMIIFQLIFLATYIFAEQKTWRNQEQTRALILDLVVADTNKIDIKITDWHHFIDAMIHQESKGNSSAVGMANDVGVMQITPIYLEEANRILGYKKYKLEDRLDPYKSIEIFNVINDRYNPEKSFYKAMRLHNPLAPESYRKSILNHYYNIR